MSDAAALQAKTPRCVLRHPAPPLFLPPPPLPLPRRSDPPSPRHCTLFASPAALDHGGFKALESPPGLNLRPCVACPSPYRCSRLRFPALLSMDVYRMRAALPHRAARNPSRDGEEPLSATTPSESAACNPFLSGDAFAPLHLPPAGKRGREWEQEGGGYDPAGVAPLIKDALVELGGEEGEAVQGLLPAGLPQTEGGGSEVNYF